MNLIAQSALFLWLPMVVVIFAILPPKRAVVAAYVTAWLGLPNVGYSIPGFPNYTKMSATVVGVLLCTVLFDMRRLFSIRFRRYDLPMVVWCVSPFFTSLTNDLGPYDGFSAVIEQVIWWGLPYLVGRLYLNDLDSIRDLALGMVIGGMAYVIPCLIEIRLSPVLELWVYGMSHWEGTRFDGYRPRVFLSTGLELGLWMANASMIGYQLWSCGAVKTFRGLPFGPIVGVLIVTSILCKATGAAALMLGGVGVLLMTRWTKKAWPVWLLLLVPPTYAVTRAFDLWSGMEVVELAKATVGGDRAESFEYRLKMENMLAKRALERPILGWGRFGRALVHNALGGQVSIPDGFWIIVLGAQGMIGLAALETMTLLPMILTIRRFPVRTWTDPQVGPLIALSMILVLTMIDFLSNGMLNPIYAVVMGAVMGQSSVQVSGGRAEATQSLELASAWMGEGRPDEAADEFHRTITLVSEGDDVEGRQIQARALDGQGHALMAQGRIDEAEASFRDALLVRDWLAATAPEAARFRDLAIARQGLARILAETGRTAEAIHEREIALQIWEILVQDHPRNEDYRGQRVEALNDLAWLFATDPDPSIQNPPHAIALAEEAIRAAGDHPASWNTLGVARYRAGDWAGAIEALEKSALSSLDGLGTAFDHYFLSMAWARLQRDGQGREWLERGVAWTARHQPGHPALERFREEAEQVLQNESGPTGTTLVKT